MLTAFRRFAVVAALSSVCLLAYALPARAQIRGLYAPGMNATNSGVLPEAGLTYVALVQPYTFDELKSPDGEELPVNLTTSVFVAQNLFLWVSDYKLLGGTYAAFADLPIANTSLTLVRFGALQAGSGLGDSYYSPFTLGWQHSRADMQAGYGFVAPTGRFHEGASDNTGSGYWGARPAAKINVGVKYLKEFANEATVEGHSLQITAAVTF